MLPSLENFCFGPLEDFSSSICLSVASEENEADTPVSVVDEGDVWRWTAIDDLSIRVEGLKTQERFSNRDFKEPAPYLSEAGPGCFNAALVHSNSKSIEEGAETHIVRSDPLFEALLQLGMGRQSSMFSFDVAKQSFDCHLGQLITSGYSVQSFQSLTSVFITCGNHFVKLQSFVETAYRGRSSCPTRIAVAATTAFISSFLLDHLGRSSKHIKSVLQLRLLFDRPEQLLNSLSSLIAKLPSNKNDEEFLSVIYGFIQDLEFSDSWLRMVFRSFLTQTSKPWLEAAGSSIGLKGSRHSGVATPLLPFYLAKNDDKITSGVLAESQIMPTFISELDGKAILKTHESLELLRSNSTDHVLTSPNTPYSLDPPQLEWTFERTDIERIEAKAKAYQANVMLLMSGTNAANQNHVPTISPFPKSPYACVMDPFAVPEELLQAQLKESFGLFDLSSADMDQDNEVDALRQGLTHAMSEDQDDARSDELFGPPLCVSSMRSLSPIISVQARLVNLACLQLLFREHKLRDHLHIQQQYHMFGDSNFTSRLSHALFDPERMSAERRKGHGRTGMMGLKLGTRSSWPPASSELRLALMGILSESYKDSIGRKMLSDRSGELPGGLSFAIRDISELELQLCMNPDSINALDFLRLTYKAPPPLDAVITLSSLEKYDTIFKLLLRVNRMLFVVTQLATNTRSLVRRGKFVALYTRRMSFEAHHFVFTICDYFFNVAIGAAWNDFDRDMAEIERKVSDISAYEFSTYESVDHLRLLHEQVLDKIMFSLFLRQRQHHAMEFLDRAFRQILELIRPDRAGPVLGGSLGAIDENTYHDFRDNVRLFIDACTRLSEKGNGHASRQGNEDDGASAIDQLLLALGMNDFYSRPVKSLNRSSYWNPMSRAKAMYENNSDH